MFAAAAEKFNRRRAFAPLAGLATMTATFATAASDPELARVVRRMKAASEAFNACWRSHDAEMERLRENPSATKEDRMAMANAHHDTAEPLLKAWKAASAAMDSLLRKRGVLGVVFEGRLYLDFSEIEDQEESMELGVPLSRIAGL